MNNKEIKSIKKDGVRKVHAYFEGKKTGYAYT